MNNDKTMTATDELRKLLDERGVRYKVEDAFYGYTDKGQRIKPTYHTIWRGENGARAEYIQCDEHDYTLLDYMRCSPEQAIAATLGSDAKPCYATDYTHERCKYSVNRGWIEDTKFYVPTATLGSGTCRLEETASYPSERGTVHVLECSNCGQECEHVNGDYEHCPHCMARNELF